MGKHKRVCIRKKKGGKGCTLYAVKKSGKTGKYVLRSVCRSYGGKGSGHNKGKKCADLRKRGRKVY